jgi:WhiB family redox-sensing transcriptional regulator
MTEWMERALCSQVDPDLFFPEGPATTVVVGKRRAKAICQKCDVRLECLEYALEADWIRDGVWAGLDAGELRRFRATRYQNTA